MVNKKLGFGLPVTQSVISTKCCHDDMIAWRDKLKIEAAWQGWKVIVWRGRQCMLAKGLHWFLGVWEIKKNYITTLTFFLVFVWSFVATPLALLRFPGCSVWATNFVPRVRQRCQEVVEDPKKTILVPVLQRQKEESNVWERLCQELSLKLLYRRTICTWSCNNLFLYNRLFYSCLLRQL